MENDRSRRMLLAAAGSSALLIAGFAGALLGGEPGKGAAGEKKIAAEKKGGPEWVFDLAAVHRFRIELSEESISTLKENHRTYVKGTLREGKDVYKDVGVHLKGSAGSFQPIDDKPGFTIKLDKYSPDQRYHGLRKIILNNAAQDPSYLSDLIGTELFRAAGLPAQRVGFARVELNGRDLGFYLILEAATREFLARWFKDPAGNLYEGPGEVDNFDELDVDSHAGVADRSDLKELAEAANEPSPKLRLERLGKILDLDRFFTFLAMEAITWHWDGYAVGVNNYYLYRDPSTGLFVFFPHGLDQLFGEPGASIDPDVQGLVARSILRTAVGRKRYRERLAALEAKVLDIEALRKRLRELGARIRPHVAGDDADAARAHEEVVDGLIDRIVERSKSIREQLAQGEPEHRKPIAFDSRGVARPGGWEPRVQMGQPELSRVSREENVDGPVFRILALEKGEWCGSFRTKVLLEPGLYRFSGKVKTRGVEPLDGSGEDGQPMPSGAGLRISGRQPAWKLLGDRGWTRVEFEFQVEPEDGEIVEDEPLLREVELVCELRAAEGAAWFAEKSLEIRKVTPR